MAHTRLETVIEALVNKLRELDEPLRKVALWPPENVSVYPFGVAFCGPFEMTQQSATLRTGLYTVIVQIHQSRRDLPRDVAKVQKYGELYPVALWNDITLGGTVSHINKVSGRFSAMEYADQQTLGWQFEVTVKLLGQGVNDGSS